MKNRSNFRELTWEAKIGFIWDYYRWHIFIAICLIIVGISTLHKVMTYHEPMLDITMINSYTDSNDADEAFQDFFHAYGYEPFDNAVVLENGIRFNIDDETSYNSSNLLMCILAAGETDMIFWTGEEFNGFMEQGILLDLTEILPSSMLETHKDKLIYTTDEDTGKHYPCALTLNGNKWVNDNKYYTDCNVGIAYSADNLDLIKDFLGYLLSSSSD